jgi:hypothetical protein
MSLRLAKPRRKHPLWRLEHLALMYLRIRQDRQDENHAQNTTLIPD